MLKIGSLAATRSVATGSTNRQSVTLLIYFQTKDKLIQQDFQFNVKRLYVANSLDGCATDRIAAVGL